jgi:hypothetical protein
MGVRNPPPPHFGLKPSARESSSRMNGKKSFGASSLCQWTAQNHFPEKKILPRISGNMGRLQGDRMWRIFAYWVAVHSGTDVMIFLIFSPKIFSKKLEFLTQNKAKLCKNLIITLVFEKNANFFAKNCQKSQKIVIITSTPGQFFRKLQM